MFSATSMSICFAFMTDLVSHPENKSALKAAVFFIFLYYVAYTLGWLGIPFPYASEIAPAKQRAQICGISTAVSWLFNFLVAEVTPVAFTDIGWRYFIVYCSLNAAWVPIIYFFFPETKGTYRSSILLCIPANEQLQADHSRKSMRSSSNPKASLIRLTSPKY